MDEWGSSLSLLWKSVSFNGRRFFCGRHSLSGRLQVVPPGSPVIMYGDIPDCNINGEGVDKEENHS